jgi:hypothetical protein
MATGTNNEREYVSIFSSFQKRRKHTTPTTVVFNDGRYNIMLHNVTQMTQIGGRGLKTDILIYHKENQQQKILKVSIKDNTSIYWGSEDKYIRERFGGIIREYIMELDDDDLVQYDERSRQYKILGKFAMRIDDAAKNKTVFGAENRRTGVDRDYTQCDIVIRGEILRKDVEEDFTKNIITFNVKRIYRTIRDIPSEEEPVLFIYNEGGAKPRATFNDVLLDITGFRGIRGAFRSRMNAERETSGSKGTWFL